MFRLAPLLALAACAASGSSGEAAAPEQHWLLVVSETPQGWRIAQRTTVDAPLPRRRDTPGEVRFSIRDASGRELYGGTRADPRHVRGEHAGAGGAIEHHRVPPPQGAAFLLRVPVLPDAHSLVLEPAHEAVRFAPLTVPFEPNGVSR